MNDLVATPRSGRLCRAEELPVDVGIAVRNFGDETVRSFLGSTPPMPGESLTGWFARVAALNAYRSLSKPLRKIGIYTPCPASLAISRRDAVERVAFLLKANVDEVRKRTFADVTHEARTTPRIDFFGVPIRPQYRNVTIRRLSPLALRISGHHRAIWELSPFSFDPHTMERLLQSCPVCGGTLGWRRTFGICYCDRCMDCNRRPTVDLRDFPQPLVEVDDMEALRFVVSLVDPERQEPLLSGLDLPPAVRDLSRGDLFDLAIFLVRVLTYELRTDGGGRTAKFNSSQSIGFPPEFMAVAGRAIVDWPQGFSNLASMLRLKQSERKGAFGLDKELGAFREMGRGARLSNNVNAILMSGMHEDMRRTDGAAMFLRRRSLRSDARMNSTQAQEVLGCGKKKLVALADSGEVAAVRHRKLIVFDGAEIESIAAARADIIGGGPTAARLGVPLGALPDLTTRGLIHRLEGPALALVSEKEQYRRSSIEALISELNACIDSRTMEEDQRLTLAASRLFVGHKPWGAIIEAIRTGQLPVRRGQSRKGGLLDQLGADPAQVCPVIAYGKILIASDPNGFTNYYEASIYFGVHVAVFCKLTAAGFLPARYGNTRRLTRSALDDFAKEYVFTEEVARQLRISKSGAMNALNRRHVKPVVTLDKSHVWLKSDVDAFLKDCPVSRDGTPAP
jgi:hypothetical protein